ncbi:hypothetical protein M419DRAFT_117500 [Trichoderma reesei RUT C-30]|jgi:hypothetical protein|uniref:Uncharacterized protein n=1 Tax=Hypocrea jecorina (strain ATCC 56765 / BCRC 32924 / NRRL 11460 / Rut C-30) TaxID=1344414 RepID=A0A024SKS7_HYPJR|nr:hypothetical protein M419DRAFT_117500 [Trichoderma reesei RUT C-30]
MSTAIPPVTRFLTRKSSATSGAVINNLQRQSDFGLRFAVCAAEARGGRKEDKGCRSTFTSTFMCLPWARQA